MKKISIFLFAGILSAVLGGCGLSPQVNLTEDEEQQVVAYASDVVLKHDANYSDGLTDTTEQRELDARVKAIEAMEQAQAAEKDDAGDGSSPDQAGESDGGAGSSQKYPPSGEQDIALALGQEGVSISFAGFEDCSSYPEDETEENYFSLDASAGKVLLVAHFDIANTTEEEVSCNILERDAFFRIVFNDTDRVNALTTLLENDLATVDTVLQPGDTYDAVVILETDPGYSEQIQSASLIIKGQEEESVVPIYGGI